MFFFLLIACLSALISGFTQEKIQVIRSHFNAVPSVIYYSDQTGDYEVRLYPSGKLKSQSEIQVQSLDPIRYETKGMFISFDPEGKEIQRGYLNKKNFEGSFYAFDEKLEVRCFFKEGALEGPYEVQHHEQQWIDKGNFIQGVLEGKRSIASEDTILFEGRYIKGELDGLVEACLKDKLIKGLFEKGVLHNVSNTSALTEYDFDGHLRTSIDYKKGVKHGFHRTYYCNEQIAYQMLYQNGMKEGFEQFFSESGKSLGGGKYSNGKPVGEHCLMYPDQKFAFVAKYNDEGILLAPCETYHQNGHLKSKFFKLNNVLEGNYKKWFENGQLAFEAKYFKGMFEGEIKQYFSNGQLESKFNYEQGVLEGWQELFFESGKRKELFCMRNGQLEGTYLTWYPNGVKKVSRQYRQGKQEGVEEHWDEDGILRRSIAYRGGVLHGLCRLNYPNGQTQCEVMFFHNKKHGKALTYAETGLVKREVEFLEDLAQGSYQTFYDDGKKSQLAHFENGLVEGVWEVYNSSETLLWSASYHQGRKEGVEHLFFPSGQLSERRHYSQGVLEGTLERWDPQGILVEQSSYKKGKLHGKKTWIDERNRLYMAYYDQGILHGSYQVFHAPDALTRRIKQIDGFYEKGKRHKTWTEYSKMGHKLGSIEFEQGIKQGEGYLYFLNGDVKGKFKFHEGLLVNKELQDKSSPS